MSFIEYKPFRVPEKYVNLDWRYQCPKAFVGAYFEVFIFTVNRSVQSGNVILTEGGQTADFGRSRFRLGDWAARHRVFFYAKIARSFPQIYSIPGKPYACSFRVRVTADNYPMKYLWKPVKHVYPNDPLFTEQWPLENIGQYDGVPGADIHVLDAWKITRCSPKVVIAVVDSGVSRIADLRNKLAGGTSFVLHRKPTRDDDGHGTAVASVAAASTNNSEGMAGVCPLGRIMPVKIAEGGTASAARQTVSRGIRWAVDHGARIINLSLIFKKDYPGMRQAVEYAYEHKVLVVAASGNNGHLSHTYPQSYPHVLVAGGSTRRDVRWDASSYGPKDLVLAASQDVLAWFGEWGLDNGNGTSLAAPEVAGLAGLILSIRADLTEDQVTAAIEQGADPVQGQNGYDLKDGYGRINCYRSLLIAQGMPKAVSR